MTSLSDRLKTDALQMFLDKLHMGRAFLWTVGRIAFEKS